MTYRSLAYRRAYDLVFYPTNQTNQSISISTADVVRESNLVEDVGKAFNLEFDVTRSFPRGMNFGKSNNATIKIYNLTGDTAKALQQPGYFSLFVGYGVDIHEIFAGSLVDAGYGIEGGDRYLELRLQSGKVTLKNKYFVKSYNKGTRLFTIIGDLVSFIQADYFNQDADVLYFQLNENENIEYKAAQSFKGDPVEILSQLLPFHHVIVNNRRVEVYRKIIEDNQTIVKTPVFDLDYNHGLIDINFTSEASLFGINKHFAGSSMRTICYPQIDINNVIRLKGDKSELINGYNPKYGAAIFENLYYRVSSIRHTGSLYGPDWISDIKGELLETMTGK